MRHAFTFILVTMLLCIGTEAQVALADVLQLKTGERVEGTFKQASLTDGVVIEIGGQSITIPFAKVRAIYFGAAPVAAPTVSVPTLSAAPTVSAAKEALDALMELQTVTNVGISYRDYSSRTLDVKIKVDRYLRGSDGDPAKSAIGAAIRYYELASQLWGVAVSRGGGGISLDQIDAIRAELLADKSCPLIQTFVGNADQKLLPYLVGQQPGILWSCASGKIGEADQLLKGKPEKPSTNPAANPTVMNPAPPVVPKTEPEPAKKPETFIIQGGESPPRKK